VFPLLGMSAISVYLIDSQEYLTASDFLVFGLFGLVVLSAGIVKLRGNVVSDIAKSLVIFTGNLAVAMTVFAVIRLVHPPSSKFSMMLYAGFQLALSLLGVVGLSGLSYGWLREKDSESFSFFPQEETTPTASEWVFLATAATLQVGVIVLMSVIIHIVQ